MSSAFPAALDNFRTDHADGVRESITAQTINELADATNKLEVKVGSGASTPVAGTFLKATGSGSSGWAALTGVEITTALGYTPYNPAGPRPFIDARAYGLDTASSDNTAAAAAIIAAIPATGAVVYVPSGVYSFTGSSTAWDLTDKENVALVGDTCAWSPYAATMTKGTVFKRTSGTGMLIDWSASTGSPNALRGCSIENICFDGNAQSTTTARLRSLYGGVFRRMVVKNGTSVGLALSTVDTTGVDDLQGCIFEQIAVNCAATAGAKGITMGSWAPGGGNVSANNFHRIMVYTQNGTGIELADADTNVFVGVLCNRSGTAIGIDLLGTTSTGGSGHARHNSFYHVDAIGGVTSRNNTTPAGPNYLFTSRGNSTPVPTIEAGSTLVWEDDLGNHSADRVDVGVGTYGSSLSGTYSASGLRLNGTYGLFGIDFYGGTFTTGAVRMKSTTSFWGRKADDSGNSLIWTWNALNEFQMDAPSRFNNSITVGNTFNIVFSQTTGTKIGTNVAEKFAFHNSTPVPQRAGAAQAVVVGTAATQTTPWGFATQAQADGIVTLVNELRAALVEKGLIKGAA